jgi:hypothetical protein
LSQRASAGSEDLADATSQALSKMGASIAAAAGGAIPANCIGICAIERNCLSIDQDRLVACILI